MQEQPDLQRGSAKIVEELLAISVGYRKRCFDLDYHLSLDEQVGAKVSHLQSSVTHQDSRFALGVYAERVQIEQQRRYIHRFEEAKTKIVVNAIKAGNDRASEPAFEKVIH